MAVEFSIPLHRSDIKVDHLEKKTCSSNDNLITNISTELESSYKDGCKSVISQFEKFCHIIRNINDFDRKEVSKLIAILITVLIQEKNIFYDDTISGIGMNMDSESKKYHRNSLKMICFVLCSLIEELLSLDETPLNKHNKVLNPKRGRKKHATNTNCYQTAQSINEFSIDDCICLMDKYVKALFKLFQKNIQHLWEPPVIEDEFFRLLINHCFKITESANVCRNKNLLRSISNLFALFIEKYNMSLSIALKMVKNLQTFEHLSLPYSQMVDIFVREFKIDNFLFHIFKEISQIDVECSNTDFVGAKSLSEFLTNVATFVPSSVYSYVSLLIPFLEKDPYSLRNSILDCLYTIVTEVLAKDDNESHKVTRMSFLLKLKDHIIDVNAYVRSHTLKLWSNLAIKQLIPLSLYNHVVEACCSRLVDKACNVRKNAVVILKHILEKNPFSANLNIGVLKANLVQEEKRLQHLLESAQNLRKSNFIDQKNDKVEIEINWEEIVDQLQSTLNDYISKNSDQNETISDEKYKNLLNNTDFNDALLNIYSLLCRKQLLEAVELFFAMKNKFDDESLFLDDIEDIKLLELIFNGIKYNDDETKKLFEEERSILDKSITGKSCDNAALPINQLLDKNQLTIRKQQILVRYIKDSLHFATLINSSMKTLIRLIHSETQSDKVEVIEFYVFAVQFGVIPFVTTIDILLPLIWTKENNLKESLVESLYKLMFQSTNDSNQATTNEKALLELMRNLTVGRNFALIELFSCFSKKDLIPKSFVSMLIECIKSKTMPKCKRAMILLGMIVKNQPSIVFENLDLLIKCGISSQTPLYNRETCLTICYAFRSKYLSAKHKEYRLPNDHMLYSTLLRVLLKTIDDPSQSHWIPMMECVCQLVVFSCDQPLKTLFLFLNELSIQNSTSLLHLTRTISMSGHCALCVLTLLHGPISEELRRRRNQLGAENKTKKLHHSSLISNTTTNNCTNMSERSTYNNEEEFNGIVLGASADDLIVEWVDSICEYNLFSEHSILQVYLKIIYNTLESSENTVNEHVPLLNACIVALGKFMLLSSSVCAEFLPLLLKHISQSKFESVTCNGLIICGDIALRFPNIIEPFTGQLFLNLKSESVVIRRTTVNVLCHLILNDMIKIKGQISELALRIGDSDREIRSKVVCFFHELSRKENAIYNILPDLVSKLSDDENVSREIFENVIRFLFKFLQKDRHCEMFMEKLCHRIPATNNENQLDLYLYCMRNIPIVGEKSIKKLLSSFDSYKDKFVIDSVRETFQSIINTARKQSKDSGGAKACIDELENKIMVTCHAYSNESNHHSPLSSVLPNENIAIMTEDKVPLKNNENLNHGGKPNFFASPIVDTRHISNNVSNNLQPSPKNSSILVKKPKKRQKFCFNNDSSDML